MERDAGDIIDRWSIAKLKAERIGNDENKKEYECFSGYMEDLEARHKDIPWCNLKKIIFSLNSFIWQFEAGLKSGKEKLPCPHYIFDDENEKALSKMGIIATLIKHYNHVRVEMKNLINKMVGEGFQDIKKNHLSE